MPVDEALSIGSPDVGVATFVVTAIERDGLLGGPDLELLARVVDATDAAVIASGGIASIADLAAVRTLGCRGAIVGRALYDGRIDLADGARGDRPVATESTAGPSSVPVTCVFVSIDVVVEAAVGNVTDQWIAAGREVVRAGPVERQSGDEAAVVELEVVLVAMSGDRDDTRRSGSRPGCASWPSQSATSGSAKSSVSVERIASSARVVCRTAVDGVSGMIPVDDLAAAGDRAVGGPPAVEQELDDGLVDAGVAPAERHVRSAARHDQVAV